MFYRDKRKRTKIIEETEAPGYVYSVQLFSVQAIPSRAVTH